MTVSVFKETVRCSCGRRAELVTGRVVHPQRGDLASKLFWRCAPCDAHVGCHAGGDRPLGTLAGPGLRLVRQRLHEAFDPLWRSGRMTRSEAYAYLASLLGVSKEDCHIGLFDYERCVEAIELLEQNDFPDGEP